MAEAFLDVQPQDKLTADDSRGTHTIPGYKVFTQHILGMGGYGLVHPAEDKDGRKVAVKRIDRASPQTMHKIAESSGKLLSLEHRNIVKVLGRYQEPHAFWLVMEFCEGGDLTGYYNKHRDILTAQDLWDIMYQTAKGLKYLHKNNIIHRDIKPGNILLTGASRLVAKLADFDTSKFLEDAYNTSVMTTNCGTPAFKAPEFWLRTPEGKLNYHRNVDVYALGLTYLALLQGNKQLKPRIETPKDDSDLRKSIGALIWERIKFKVTPLEIIPEDLETEDDSEEPQAKQRKTADPRAESSTAGEAPRNLGDPEFTRKLRRLIRRMTCVKPEERISAQEVVQELLRLGPMKQVNLEHLATNPTIRFFDGDDASMAVMPSSGMVVIREGERTRTEDSSDEDKSYAFHCYRVSGSEWRKVKEYPSLCPHFARILSITIENKELIAERGVGLIRLYDMETGESFTAFQHPQNRPLHMCLGDEGKMLVSCYDEETSTNQILLLNCSTKEFHIERSVPCNKPMYGLRYVPKHQLAVGTGFNSEVHALSLSTGQEVWSVDTTDDVLVLEYSSEHDAVLVLDAYSDEVVVLNAQDGEHRQVVPLPGCGWVQEMCLHNGQLFVLHRGFQEDEEDEEVFVFEVFSLT